MQICFFLPDWFLTAAAITTMILCAHLIVGILVYLFIQIDDVKNGGKWALIRYSSLCPWDSYLCGSSLCG